MTIPAIRRLVSRCRNHTAATRPMALASAEPDRPLVTGAEGRSGVRPWCSVSPVPDAPMPMTGRCLCGAATYSADAEPMVQAICHCTDCQRQTGNPFSVIVAVPAASFSSEGDTITTYATVGEDQGGGTQPSFCSCWWCRAF